MLPLHFTPDLQLEAGAQSSTGLCNSNPGILLYTHLMLPPVSIFTAGTGSDTANAELLRQGGLMWGMETWLPQTVPSKGPSHPYSRSGLVLWCSQEPVLTNRQELWQGWHHLQSLMGCSQRAAGWLISHNLRVYGRWILTSRSRIVTSAFYRLKRSTSRRPLSHAVIRAPPLIHSAVKWLWCPQLK